MIHIIQYDKDGEAFDYGEDYSTKYYSLEELQNFCDEWKKEDEADGINDTYYHIMDDNLGDWIY